MTQEFPGFGSRGRGAEGGSAAASAAEEALKKAAGSVSPIAAQKVKRRKKEQVLSADAPLNTYSAEATGV